MNSKPKILAIDDHPLNLKTLGAALVNDYDFQVATNGRDGLALASAAKPDLILLDCMMPEMDGFEVCRRLKADTELKRIPVIFITALSEVDAETFGLELGAADYLLKPINVPIARLRIRNLLEREALRQEIEVHRNHLEALVAERTLSLSIAKEAAEGASRIKANILANISHEFRTPMNGIMGMVGLARRRSQDPKVVDYLLKAEQAAQHLLGTLTGLLDLALVESNRLTVERTAFCLTDVLEKTRAQFGARIEEKGLQFELCKESQFDPARRQIIGDPLRIAQIVHELIDNAIKFSAQDGVIAIRAALEKNSSGQHLLVLQVRDEGIGIAAAELPHIFEPFHQVDASPTRHYGGNGIGLALCHQLARHMGGTLSVISTPGCGSTFTLSIPTDLSAASAQAVGTAEQSSAELRARHAGKPILVVEDDRSIQVFIKAILELAGLDVSVAGDGSDAIDQARTKKFKLILMDLVMPGVSGIDASKAIRSLPSYTTVPILAVTARAFEDDRDACFLAGINAHIPKPITRELLLGTVLQYLDAGRYIDSIPRVN